MSTSHRAREHLQFRRPLGHDHEGREVVVDLLARPPEGDENKLVRFDSRRVKVRGPKLELHGRVTPEAFAVEDSVVSLPVIQERSVHVPHAFSWICMKTMAAHDWWRNQHTARAKPASEKHSFDVYLLVAMLTETELVESEALQQRYTGHVEMAKVRDAAVDLFATRETAGFLQAQETAMEALDFETFWDGYRAVLGIT